MFINKTGKNVQSINIWKKIHTEQLTNCRLWIFDYGLWGRSLVASPAA